MVLYNKPSILWSLPFLILFCIILPVYSSRDETVKSFYTASDHTNNWAVLVATSRFWFNYRHMSNVLGMYRTVRRLGIPDSQIILMLADDVACNSRNTFPGTAFNNADRALDLYGDSIEVDYRGYEVTVENFIRLLTEPDTPRSKRLLTDDRSNIFVYMTGHGGDEFLKFQDAEEISAFDLADAFEQMWEKKRYSALIDSTNKANTMYSKFYSPNILASGSSEIKESSYSHHADSDIGVAVIDRYTYYTLDFLERNVDVNSQLTIKDLFDSYDKELINSTPGIRTDLFKRPLEEVKITDFFGSVQNVEVSLEEMIFDFNDTYSPSSTSKVEKPFLEDHKYVKVSISHPFSVQIESSGWKKFKGAIAMGMLSLGVMVISKLSL